MDIDVRMTNGDWSKSVTAGILIQAPAEIIGTIDVTAAVKKAVAQVQADLKAKLAEAEQPATD